MANWDQEQLAEVVEKRHGEENSKKNATQIVSSRICKSSIISFSKRNNFFNPYMISISSSSKSVAGYDSKMTQS